VSVGELWRLHLENYASSFIHQNAIKIIYWTALRHFKLVNVKYNFQNFRKNECQHKIYIQVYNTCHIFLVYFILFMEVEKKALPKIFSFMFLRRKKVTGLEKWIRWQIFMFGWTVPLNDKFDILHLQPCFNIVSNEIERLRLKFGHMLLSREILVSVVSTCGKASFAMIFVWAYQWTPHTGWV